VTDATKRALKTFGNVLGNCLYDKEYAKEVVKIRVPPVSFLLLLSSHPAHRVSQNSIRMNWKDDLNSPLRRHHRKSRLSRSPRQDLLDPIPLQSVINTYRHHHPELGVHSKLSPRQMQS